MGAAISAALFAAAAVACSTVLDIDGESDDVRPPTSESGSDGNGATDGNGGSDGELPSDGAAGDGRPDSADASVDNYVPPPACPAPGCERVVFVTSAPMNRNVAGGSGDVTCTSAFAGGASAVPRVKGRQFQAWISNAAGSPALRFVQGTGKYIRPDGMTIAENWADLTDGTLAASISVDEKGAPVSLLARTWTGTGTNGAKSVPDCAAWTSSSSADTARVGVVGKTNADWTSSSVAAPCDEQLYLYCFEK